MILCLCNERVYVCLYVYKHVFFRAYMFCACVCACVYSLAKVPAGLCACMYLHKHVQKFMFLTVFLSL